MTYIWVFAGMILLLTAWSLLEQKLIIPSRYIISSQMHGLKQQDLTFVVLADIHNCRYGKNNKTLIKKIQKQKPDFIIIAGDIITKRIPCYPGNAYNLIEALSEQYPIYYALGNHEQAFEDYGLIDDNKSDYNEFIELHQSWSLLQEKLVKLGVYILDNKSVMIHYNNSKIAITGLSLSADYFRKGRSLILEQDEITSRVGKRSSEAYQILIAHNPLYFRDYIQWGADLTLSGHVHGGMVRIPFVGGVISPQVKLFPKYDGGQYSEGNQHMIVSRGLGSHSFMPRFFNPPDLVVIKLKGE